MNLRMCECMKKWVKLVSFLAVITIVAFTFAKTPFSSIAGATYVEGAITQDTVWTLTDSPFVVSKNIIVCQNATLTLEPGVEVRFGGDFSLTVEGRLSVSGEENNPTTFTSNKDQPKAGDWGTIKFNKTESSTLAYCIVQYAKNAITIEDSSVRIEKCEISTNSLNGILIANSIAEVKNNEIANNFESGIYVTGDNRVTIQNNTISSNTNDILLTGNSTTGVSITENIVMSNTKNGIQLDAKNYNNLVILNNILSANHNGFYVSGQASTYITTNSVSYNTIGIFYEKGMDHVAYYNDIYGNEYGMDISYNATVNAEYNYWGHESGPYHISLNPAGKGNPVGGDGVNLDFIFFLTAPISHINTRPIARLLTDKTLVPPNHVVTFIATTSSDEGRVDKYFFHFGDGNNSGWTTLSIFAHEYSSFGTYHANVTVMDDFGVTSSNVATATINVEDLNPLKVSVTSSKCRVRCGEQVSITVEVTYASNAVENARTTLFAVKSGDFTPSSGLTNSTGRFTTTFIAPNVTQITKVRITATASKDGYADGSDYTYLTILPRLSVEIATDPASVKSEETSEVTVYVTYSQQPIPDALVTIWSDGGNLSAIEEITDLNGSATFLFTAPQTATQLNITITATATKAGYADGQGQTKITIEPKILVVELVANPTTVKSEEKSYVTAHVTCDSVPISGVNVTISSVYGTFSPETCTTDSNGNATFTFTAPQMITQLNVTIRAIATKAGYADGQGQTEITIEPKILVVEAAAEPTTLTSEAVSQVTVHVSYDGMPIPNATVTISSDAGGNFSAESGITDMSGNIIFTFTAPQAVTQLNVTITVTTTKIGYADREARVKITVNPGTLNVQVTASPVTVESRTISTITVHATCNANPVADALVTIWCDGGGNFSAIEEMTDSNGGATFVFTAPQTITQLNITITATATKTGYVDGQGQTKITVNPEVIPEPGGGIGLPLTTILIIVVLIVTIAIVLLLIKLKIIHISWKEK